MEEGEEAVVRRVEIEEGFEVDGEEAGWRE